MDPCRERPECDQSQRAAWSGSIEPGGSRESRRGSMARRGNYGFVKRQKEVKRQQKKEEKAEKKRLKKESGDGEGQEETVNGDDDLDNP